MTQRPKYLKYELNSFSALVLHHFEISRFFSVNFQVQEIHFYCIRTLRHQWTTTYIRYLPRQRIFIETCEIP